MLSRIKEILAGMYKNRIFYLLPKIEKSKSLVENRIFFECGTHNNLLYTFQPLFQKTHVMIFYWCLLPHPLIIGTKNIPSSATTATLITLTHSKVYHLRWPLVREYAANICHPVISPQPSKIRHLRLLQNSYKIGFQIYFNSGLLSVRCAVSE